MSEHFCLNYLRFIQEEKSHHNRGVEIISFFNIIQILFKLQWCKLWSWSALFSARFPVLALCSAPELANINSMPKLENFYFTALWSSISLQSVHMQLVWRKKKQTKRTLPKHVFLGNRHPTGRSGLIISIITAKRY